MKQQITTEKKKCIIIISILAAILIGVLIVTGVFLLFFSRESYRLVKVDRAEGDITIEREKDNNRTQVLDAFEGQRLISEDFVTVGSDSFLELLADDDKYIGAEANTEFVLHATGKKKSGNITIELVKGKALLTLDQKLEENSEFEVTTPNATLSVRGTRFSVAYDPEKRVTTVEVYKGKVWASYHGGEEVLEEDDVLYLTDNGISSEGENSVSETTDTGTSDAENIDKESADLESTDAERLIYIARFYANDTLYLFEENSLIIQVETKQYEEEERNGSYYAEYGEGDISSPLEQFLYELDRDNIEPHREEINTFFEENKSEAIDAMQNGEETAEMDVTDWFPETMILPGEQNTYTCHVSSVTMAFAPGYVTKENVGPLEVYPSRVYIDGEYYWYMSGVCFLVDGIME